ncbi:hypothetical protein [Vibrio sp. YIC-376]|uniref:hypothetical protein n=1 Tax=Vibrio sp. YIC-376 TaxID=3136162 RepID=UPI00402AB3E0
MTLEFFIVLFLQLISSVLVVLSVLRLLPKRMSNLQKKNAQLTTMIVEKDEITRELFDKIAIYSSKNDSLTKQVQELKDEIKTFKVKSNHR